MTKPINIKRSKTKADYDFPIAHNAKGGRIHRVPQIEKKDEDEILSAWKRMGGVNLARDMWRNAPQVHGLLRNLRVNIIGTEGKLRFHRTGEWYDAAAKWFQRWSKRADYITGQSFREIEQLAVYAVLAEGDFAVCFDDGELTGGTGTGKVATWEADQITNLNEEDFKSWADAGYTQLDGVVKDPAGRVCGVIVTSKRGEKSVPLSDALPFIFDTPEEFEASPVRLVARRFRLHQVRGVADAIPSLQTQCDIHDILGSELTTARVASSRYAVVIDPPDNTNDTTPTGYDDTGAGDDPEPNAEGDTGDEIDEDAVVEAEEKLQQANGLEDYTGGSMDYLENGSQVLWDPANRPNANLPGFLDFVGDQVAMPFGLYHSFARMKSDSSYTAFRGDLAQTERHFADFRQWLEDAFLDFIGERAIQWAIDTKALDEPPDEDWADAIAWTYPPVIAVDEGKEVAATVAQLKAGLKSMAEVLGPDWRAKVKTVADEKEYMHSLGLTHPQDETAAGVPVNEDTNSESAEEDDDWDPVTEEEAREDLANWDGDENENEDDEAEGGNQ